MTLLATTVEPRIVVLGAGVLGLTTALQLTRQGFKNVTVVAKHMPGDSHPDYTSIWAGANWVPVSSEGSEHATWDVEAWHELKRLADSVPAAGVWIQDKISYYRNEDLTQDKLHLWFKDLVQDFKILGREDVPDFADWGTFYRTLSLDPSIYLHYLQSTCLSMGVAFRRGTFSHIQDAFFATGDASVADVVVNCTGLLASKLGGVMDEAVTPIRGQLVIVENESPAMVSWSGDSTMDDKIGECCYVINRPSAGGTALGGCEYLDWNQEPDMALAKRMMERAVKVCPGLVPPGSGVEALRVIRHQVGLRPHREGGPRIEKEALHHPTHGALRVVHCYGAGGFGFQSSYGMASKAVRLVGESLLAPRE